MGIRRPSIGFLIPFNQPLSSIEIIKGLTRLVVDLVSHLYQLFLIEFSKLTRRHDFTNGFFGRHTEDKTGMY
jgi:hypothetical protein